MASPPVVVVLLLLYFFVVAFIITLSPDDGTTNPADDDDTATGARGFPVVVVVGGGAPSVFCDRRPAAPVLRFIPCVYVCICIYTCICAREWCVSVCLLLLSFLRQKDWSKNHRQSRRPQRDASFSKSSSSNCTIYISPGAPPAPVRLPGQKFLKKNFSPSTPGDSLLLPSSRKS